MRSEAGWVERPRAPPPPFMTRAPQSRHSSWRGVRAEARVGQAGGSKRASFFSTAPNCLICHGPPPPRPARGEIFVAPHAQPPISNAQTLRVHHRNMAELVPPAAPSNEPPTVAYYINLDAQPKRRARMETLLPRCGLAPRRVCAVTPADDVHAQLMRACDACDEIAEGHPANSTSHPWYVSC